MWNTANIANNFCRNKITHLLRLFKSFLRIQIKNIEVKTRKNIHFLNLKCSIPYETLFEVHFFESTVYSIFLKL